MGLRCSALVVAFAIGGGCAGAPSQEPNPTADAGVDVDHRVCEGTDGVPSSVELVDCVDVASTRPPLCDWAARAETVVFGTIVRKRLNAEAVNVGGAVLPASACTGGLEPGVIVEFDVTHGVGRISDTIGPADIHLGATVLREWGLGVGGVDDDVVLAAQDGAEFLANGMSVGFLLTHDDTGDANAPLLLAGVFTHNTADNCIAFAEDACQHPQRTGLPTATFDTDVDRFFEALAACSLRDDPQDDDVGMWAGHCWGSN